MRHRWRSAQGCHHRNEPSRGRVWKPPAHRPNREMAPGTRPRRRDTQAQRSDRVLRSTVAVSKTGGSMGHRVAGAHTDLQPNHASTPLARSRGNGSSDLSKTERANLMTKSPSGDRVSVQ